MLRRFNYTKRELIKKDDAKITLKDDHEGQTFFEINLKLESYLFPTEAQIRLEAWRSNAVQRWDFGEIGNPKELSQQERTLDGIPPTSQFKLIVVSPDRAGLLLGKTKAIKPLQTGRWAKSLLPVDTSNDLGQEVWKLDFSDQDQVVLLINDSIPNVEDVISKDTSFRSLVMPEVFRSILQHAVLVDGVSIDDLEDDKWGEWLALAHKYVDSGNLQESSISQTESQETEALDWIESVVKAFASDSKLMAADTYTKEIAE